MHDDMIWRAAEAIYNSDFDGSPSQAFADRDLDVIGTYLDGARAAIQAMREPTDAQRNAYFELSYRTEAMIDAHWERAIDAALSFPVVTGDKEKVDLQGENE